MFIDRKFMSICRKMALGSPAYYGAAMKMPLSSLKEPLISCESGMQGKASRSETRGLS